MLSILISSHNRIELFRNTIDSIVMFPPPCDYEVVVADDGSTDDILGMLQSFPIKGRFVRVDNEFFKKITGYEHYLNNPSLTNNVAFRYSKGDQVALVGNDMFLCKDALSIILEESKLIEGDYLLFSTTFDLMGNPYDAIRDKMNFTTASKIFGFPLQHAIYCRTDVTNYLSLCNRALWEKIKGYDERYVGGVACEDSDFVRRARTAGATTKIVNNITFHQYHGGKTMYYEPTAYPSEKFQKGVGKNRLIYNDWDGHYENRQKWNWGTVGVTEVIEFGGAS